MRSVNKRVSKRPSKRQRVYERACDPVHDCSVHRGLLKFSRFVFITKALQKRNDICSSGKSLVPMSKREELTKTTVCPFYHWN